MVHYSEPHRLYHTLSHLDDCLHELDEAVHLSTDPDAVELAIWYHDSLYDSTAADNELRSAALAESILMGAGCHLDWVSRVASLILWTRHDRPADDPEAQLIQDIDLSILGQPAPRYEAYEQRIRQEYRRVPEPEFMRKRVTLLERFLTRPRLYRSTFFYKKYEAHARSNFLRSLTQLTGLLRA